MSATPSEDDLKPGTEVICYPRSGKIRSIVVNTTPTGRKRIRYLNADDIRRFGEFHTVGPDKLARVQP